jgi:cytochrome c556
MKPAQSVFTLKKVCALAAVIAVVLAATFYGLRRSQVAGLRHREVQDTDLSQVMRAKVHPDYTFLSFTIWHDVPLDSQKMDAIAGSAKNIKVAAHTVGEYQSLWSSGNGGDFFRNNVQELDEVAGQLEDAARKHDPHRVENLFAKMDGVCQNCHSRFRPDLSAQAVPAYTPEAHTP